MNAWLNYVGVGCVALSVLACGSKGDGEGDDGEGTGGTGATGSGGTGTGGSATGGTSGSATGGSGGGATSMIRHAFTDGAEGWIVEYTSSGKLVDMTTDAPLIDKSTVILEHITTDGDPEPGALQGSIPYETESQYVGFGINYMPAVDLSASALTARVKLVSGLADPAELMATPGGAKLYAKSGTGYCYAAGEYNNLGVVGSWMTIRFDLTRPPSYVATDCATPFDSSDVLEIGIQFDTGGMTVTAEPAVVLIDSISY